MPKQLGNFTPPKLTTAERDAISWTSGAIIYNTTKNKVEYYNGSAWVETTGTGGGLTFADVWAANTLTNC